MKNRVSPTFITAGVVIGLSCFVLLSMLFYGPSDYDAARAGAMAEKEGLRFGVANMFFGSLGLGAYIGWAIILAWGVVVFFREQAGDLALRGASLVVVVVSGATLTALLGAERHGGDLGQQVGTMLQSGLGTTLGVLLMLGIFGVSLVYATDYGFVRYIRQAREAIAVIDEDEEEEIETEEKPTDWSRLIDQAVEEVEEVRVEAPEEEPIDTELDTELATADFSGYETEVVEQGEGKPLVLNFKSPIEEEDLDEDLLVKKVEIEDEDEESGVAVALPPAFEIEEEPDEELAPKVEMPPPEVATEIEAPEPVEDGVLLEQDIIVEAEVAEATRAMLEALEEQPVVVEVSAEEPAPIVEEATEATAEELIEVLSPEPEEEPEEAAARDSMEDLDSVFDALLGSSELPPAMPPAPKPEVREEPAVVQAPVVETPVIETPVVEDGGAEEAILEEPTFLLDDEITVMEETIVEETIVEEPIVEEPIVEEGEPEPIVVEAETIATTPPAESIQEVEQAITDAIAEEVHVEQVVEAEPIEEIVEEDEEALLPFMEEEAEEPAPVPTPEVEPIPVLEDVAAPKKKPGVLKSLFGKKDAAGRATDPLIGEAALLAIEKGRASVVLLQRRLDIGYTRASRLVDALEREGLVGPLLESGSREVLMTLSEWEEKTQ